MKKNIFINFRHLTLIFIIISVIVVFGDVKMIKTARSSTQYVAFQEQFKKDTMKKIINEQHLPIISDGDIILGGLFPVHKNGKNNSSEPMINRAGVEQLEAMMYAVDRINDDPDILEGIKIGVHILDTWSLDTFALQQSLQFIGPSIKSNIVPTSSKCPDNSIKCLQKDTKIKPLAGVVGDAYGSISKEVANLLLMFNIPQISPATSDELLVDTIHFDLSARIIPPDVIQPKVLLDIAVELQWTYVTVIYSEGTYGKSAIELFEKEANKRNVCIANSEEVSTLANEITFDQIIAKLKKKLYAKGVFLFTTPKDSRAILKAAQRAKLRDPFTWIASDAWGKHFNMLDGVNDIAEGALTIELQSRYIAEFDKYMQALTPETNKRNPWFDEYWEDFFSCTMLKNIKIYFQGNTRVCLPDLRLTENNGYEQEPKIQFVIDAVYAFAYALNNLQKDVCPKDDQKDTVTGLCPAMANFDGASLYKDYILNLAFEDIAGSEVKFDGKGDGLALYDIYNYQKIPNTTSYHYKLVGKWHNSLVWNLDQITWNTVVDFPVSECATPCRFGFIRHDQEGTCCWTCEKCKPYEYLPDDYTCIDCGLGRWPSFNKRECLDLIEDIDEDTNFKYVSLVLSGVGAACTVTVIGVFILFRNNRIVRTNGYEFHIILLPDLLFNFLNTLLLFERPSIFYSYILRFTIPIGFTIIYSVILVKTNRLSRIFQPINGRNPIPRFIKPMPQVLIFSGIVAIQVIIILIFLHITPPGIQHIYPFRDYKILRYKPEVLSFTSSSVYNTFLVFCCTYYAYNTRLIPANYNEFKHTAIAMYASNALWVVFLFTYILTMKYYQYQLETIRIFISANGIAILLCIYIPKIYLIMTHPDQHIYDDYEYATPRVSVVFRMPRPSFAIKIEEFVAEHQMRRHQFDNNSSNQLDIMQLFHLYGEQYQNFKHNQLDDNQQSSEDGQEFNVENVEQAAHEELEEEKEEGLNENQQIEDDQQQVQIIIEKSDNDKKESNSVQQESMLDELHLQESQRDYFMFQEELKIEIPSDNNKRMPVSILKNSVGKVFRYFTEIEDRIKEGKKLKTVTMSSCSAPSIDRNKLDTIEEISPILQIKHRATIDYGRPSYFDMENNYDNDEENTDDTFIDDLPIEYYKYNSKKSF